MYKIYLRLKTTDFCATYMLSQPTKGGHLWSQEYGGL